MALRSITLRLRTHLILLTIAIVGLLVNHRLLHPFTLNNVTTEYLPSILSNNDVNSENETVANETIMENKKFLLGIFSTMSEKSRKRRQLIRETYLNVSKQISRPWLCSLDRYQHFLSIGDIQIAEDCVIIYTFIVADAPDQPEDHYRTSRPITITPDNREIETVYLNIKENMEEGKSYTYFKYAYQLSNEIKIDYVAKTDDDTFLFIPDLYQYFIVPLPGPPYNKRYYGGHTTDYVVCAKHVWCDKISPHGYFAGQFYFMSTDLAGVVSDDSTERFFGGSDKSIEDLDMGYQIFQWSSQSKIPINQYASIPAYGGPWVHPCKEDEKWLEIWESCKKRFPEYYLNITNASLVNASNTKV